MSEYFTQLNHILSYMAKCCPHKVALWCMHEEFTYQQLNTSANQFAHYLISCGIVRSDRIIVSVGNLYESIISFWGTLKIGAIISLVSADISSEKLRYILKDSGAKGLICSYTQYQKMHGWIAQCEHSLINILLHDSVSPSENFYAVLQELPTIEVQSVALDIDLASIIYTSGSTGEPKGVMLTHRNMLAALAAVNQYLEYCADDIIISVLPLAFDYGLYQMIMAFSVGATLILERDFTWPTALLKKIATYKVSILPIVPSMVPLLYQHGSRFKYDLSSVRCITSTGGALNLKYLEMLKQQFPAARIFSMYGLTECKRCTYLPPEKLVEKPMSVGIAIPNTELWIVDEMGKPLGPNQLGELVVRGATVMQGYWGKPEKTAKKLKNGTTEKVLYTGDYCWLDKEGFLYFYARMDEIIKCRGIKVSPQDIERNILQHPAVIEVAVVGLDDIECDTVIHAAVVLSPKATVKDINHHCCRQLSIEQRPQFITAMESLPKLSNGKVNKIFLKSQLSRSFHTVNKY